MPGGARGAGEEHGAEGRVLPQETPVPGRGGDARTAHTAAMGCWCVREGYRVCEACLAISGYVQGGGHDFILFAEAGTGWQATGGWECPNSECPRAGCRWAGRVRRLQREGEAVFRPEESVPRTFNQESGELLK